MENRYRLHGSVGISLLQNDIHMYKSHKTWINHAVKDSNTPSSRKTMNNSVINMQHNNSAKCTGTAMDSLRKEAECKSALCEELFLSSVRENLWLYKVSMWSTTPSLYPYYTRAWGQHGRSHDFSRSVHQTRDLVVRRPQGPMISKETPLTFKSGSSSLQGDTTGEGSWQKELSWLQ